MPVCLHLAEALHSRMTHATRLTAQGVPKNETLETSGCHDVIITSYTPAPIRMDVPARRQAVSLASNVAEAGDHLSCSRWQLLAEEPLKRITVYIDTRVGQPVRSGAVRAEPG